MTLVDIDGCVWYNMDTVRKKRNTPPGEGVFLLAVVQVTILAYAAAYVKQKVEILGGGDYRLILVGSKSIIVTDNMRK